MNTVAIIQARMGSTRLPGKIMKEVCGRPLLWHLLSRLKYSKRIKKIVVAIPTLKQDDIIEKNVRKWGFDVFRGDPNDLLDRYYKAARKFKANTIVRITADCPLIDPKIVDMVLKEYSSGNFDVVKTDETFPDGLDAATFSFAAIEKAWKEARLPSEREHVGTYILNHPEMFRIKIITNNEDLGYMRWTVDEERDYQFVKAVFERLYEGGKMFYMKDVLDLLKKEPKLQDINKNIIRNEGYLKSLKEDAAVSGETVSSMIKLSKFCLGCAQLGNKYGINNTTGKPNSHESLELVRLAVENGITTFDTAPVYGDSQKVLGECLSELNKYDLTIISRVPPVEWGKGMKHVHETIETAFYQTLSDLGMDKLPIILFHKFSDIEKGTYMILNILRKLKSKGLIGKIGASIYTPGEAETTLKIEDLDVIQVPINLIDKRLIDNGFLKRAKDKGKTILARTVFLQGLFFKKVIPSELKGFLPYQNAINKICADENMDAAELALRYVLGIEQVDSIAVGMETVDQLKRNIEIMKKQKLSDKILSEIENIGSAPENIINPSLWGKHR